jgi:hypothetical protein
MPKKIGKIWTPINTTDPDQVTKNPRTAKFQKLRNQVLIWSVNLKSARIEIRKGQHGPTADRVATCLELLGKDLGNSYNKLNALQAIGKLIEYSANWNDSLTLVLPTKPEELQQLRKNVQLLFNPNMVKEERPFLEAVYKKCDARLAGPKGYYHVELAAPLPAQTPAPTAPVAASPVAASPFDVPPPNDAPPPPPIVVKDPPKAPEAPAEHKTAEEPTGGEPIEKIKQVPRRVPRHVRYATDQTRTKKPVAEKPVKEEGNSLHMDQLERQLDVELKYRPLNMRTRLMSAGAKPNAAAEKIQTPRLAAAPHVTAAPEAPFDLDELEELLTTGLPRQPESVQSPVAQEQSQETPQTPRTVPPPAPEANPPICAEPTKEEIKEEVRSKTPNSSRRELSQKKKMLEDTRYATPIHKPPHWVASLEIRTTPKERAADLAEGLLRAIENKPNTKRDIGQKWLFFFLNRLADPELAEFIPGAIKNAVSGRMIGDSNLRYVNNLLHTVHWHLPEFDAPRGEWLRSICELWKTLKGAAPTLNSEETLMPNREWFPLQGILRDMELPPPASARPAAPATRPNWPPNNQ